MGTTNSTARGPGLDTLRDGLAPHQAAQDAHADEQNTPPAEQEESTVSVDSSCSAELDSQPEPVEAEEAVVAPPVIAAGALTASLRALGDLPEATGWRKLLRLGPSKTQLQAAERKARLLVGFPGSVSITAVSVKGGAGKTPTMRGVMAALANARGGGVGMVDMNELRGTALLRSVVSHDRHIGDLLGNIEYLLGRHAQISELEWCMSGQPDSSEWVLASDPETTAAISWDDFTKLHTVLKRFYSIVGFDTGNAELSVSWRASVRAADAYVVPMKWRADHVEPAVKMLETMLERDTSVQTRTIIVGTNNVGESDPLARQLAKEHFTRLGLPIQEIPIDPGLNQQVIRWNSLKPATQVAFEELAAELLVKATTTAQQKGTDR